MTRDAWGRACKRRNSLTKADPRPSLAFHERDLLEMSDDIGVSAAHFLDERQNCELMSKIVNPIFVTLGRRNGVRVRATDARFGSVLKLSLIHI